MPLRPQVCYELTSGSRLSFAGVECEYHVGMPPEKHSSGDDTPSDVEVRKRQLIEVLSVSCV